MTNTLVNPKSTHVVEVVPIKLDPHPNADTLSIIKVYNFTVVGNTEAWKGVDKAAYIPPDSLVDTSRPEFDFLNIRTVNNEQVRSEPYWHRITARQLRGIISYGMLAKAPEGSKIGDNVAEILNVQHYDPSITESGECASAPPVVSPKYDVDTFLKFAKVFKEGEEVIYTEKIHGESSRFVFVNGEMHCGSHTNWKKPPSQWWDVYDRTPAIKEFCEANPGYILYGELYGHVGGYPYDCKKGERKIRIFDIMKDSQWLSYDELMDFVSKFNLPCVPFLHRGPYNFEEAMNMAVGNSALAVHIREGCVIKPVKERFDERLGRVNLKIINPEYYDKKNKKKKNETK